MQAGGTIYSLAVLVHVLAAVTWVGGVLFMALAAVPVAKRFDPETKDVLTDRLGKRFRTIGWSAIGVLILTGLFMLGRWGATPENILDGSFFNSPHTRLLGYKLLLVGAMILVSGLHDWYVGPKASRLSDAEARRKGLKTWAAWLGRLTGILAVTIVVLAVFVARPWL
jgi:uncharacterized membrane protein